MLVILYQQLQFLKDEIDQNPNFLQLPSISNKFCKPKINTQQPKQFEVAFSNECNVICIFNRYFLTSHMWISSYCTIGENNL